MWVFLFFTSSIYEHTFSLSFTDTGYYLFLSFLCQSDERKMFLISTSQRTGEAEQLFISSFVSDEESLSLCMGS